MQASAPVQRAKRGPAAKILVTCEVTIACIGTNSGTGEEWSDKENALTGAEAQAFKGPCPVSDWDGICTISMGSGLS